MPRDYGNSETMPKHGKSWKTCIIPTAQGFPGTRPSTRFWKQIQGPECQHPSRAELPSSQCCGHHRGRCPASYKVCLLISEPKPISLKRPPIGPKETHLGHPGQVSSHAPRLLLSFPTAVLGTSKIPSTSWASVPMLVFLAPIWIDLHWSIITIEYRAQIWTYDIFLYAIHPEQIRSNF